MPEPDLDALIEAARKHVTTPEEREAQIRSFAYGNVRLANDRTTREDVERAMEKLRMPETKSELTGRELDAAVCGMMERKPKKSPLDFQPWRDESPAGWWTAEGSYLEPEQACWRPQPVSTDITLAMRTYAVMHEQGWWIRLQHEQSGWCCVMMAFREAEGAVGHVAYAASPAEAICRAIVEAGGE